MLLMRWESQLLDAEITLFLIKFAAVFFKPCQVVVDFSYRQTGRRAMVVAPEISDIYGGYPACFSERDKVVWLDMGSANLPCLP